MNATHDILIPLPISFGELHTQGSTVTYIANANWKELSNDWMMRMYQTRPGTNEPVDLQSITLPSFELLEEFGLWDELSDEALLNFEDNLGE